MIDSWCMCSVTRITVDMENWIWCDYYFWSCVDFNLLSLNYELACWKVRVSVMYFRAWVDNVRCNQYSNLDVFSVYSHSCRMGGLHSWWQPVKVTLTVLESCFPQEPWWTWLTKWVYDTKLMCLYRQHVHDHHIIRNYLHVPYSPENIRPLRIYAP